MPKSFRLGIWGALALGVCLGFWGLSLPVATAFPFFFDTWQDRYPNSLTSDNGGCNICHGNSQFNFNRWNPYGWAVRERIEAGLEIDAALAEVENLDSDQDPSQSSNLAEILADTQPGWTDGTHNTIYFSGSPPVTDQPPPTFVMGDLDPTVVAVEFIRGDADGSGVFNGLVDGLFVLDYQFSGGSPPPCLEAADGNDDGVFSGLTDALYLLNHQFLGGPPPGAPYPDCGSDPAPSTSLGCSSHPGCS